MGRRSEEGKRASKRRVIRWIVLGGGLAAVAYAFAKRQKPGPCIPAGKPEDRVLVKDEENISGLGSIMHALITQLLQDPRKLAILDELNLVLAIEPKGYPETAVTMTFSDGYVVLEPGVVASPDVHIICAVEDLMQMAGMGWGFKAAKFMRSPAGQELARKFTSGELQIKGLVTHPIGMMRFSRLLATSET